MVPSLPPLCAIRPETDDAADRRQQQQPQPQPQQRHHATRRPLAPPALPLPAAFAHALPAPRRHDHAPSMIAPPAAHSRFTPAPLQHTPHTQQRMFAGPPSTAVTTAAAAAADAAAAGSRRHRPEDSSAYAHHREQLRSMVLHSTHYDHTHSRAHQAHERKLLRSFSRHHDRGRSATPSSSGLYDSHYSPTSLRDDNDDDARGGGVNERPSVQRAARSAGREGNCEPDPFLATDAAARRSSVSSQDALADSPSNSSGTATVDPTQSKKARRKEQCRVNQANYRKRKRMYENELSGQIKTLELEISELNARKQALHEQTAAEADAPYSHGRDHKLENRAQSPALDPIALIGDFYYALECARLDVPHGVQLDYPNLHSLFQLQQQEYSSIDALQLQWLWYREQFDVFNLFVSASERLDAGDQVIIRISAQLHIQVPMRRHLERRDDLDGRESKGRSDDWVAQNLVCPVLQQFEFHAHERVLTQITSEIDWTAGVAALVEQRPEHTLLLLQELVDEVATRWCC